MLLVCYSICGFMYQTSVISTAFQGIKHFLGKAFIEVFSQFSFFSNAIWSKTPIIENKPESELSIEGKSLEFIKKVDISGFNWHRIFLITVRTVTKWHFASFISRCLIALILKLSEEIRIKSLLFLRKSPRRLVTLFTRGKYHILVPSVVFYYFYPIPWVLFMIFP